MSAVERCEAELAAALRTTGRSRQRLLAESREHLRESAALHGDDAAVSRFGDPREIARAFDLEQAATRTRVATGTAIAAVAAVAVGVVGLAHAAGSASAPGLVWVVAFWIAGQVAAVAAAVSFAGALRRRGRPAPDALLGVQARRARIAVAAATVTLLSAAAATGGGSAASWAALLGPLALLALATEAGRRARSLVRALAVDARVAASPLADLATALGDLGRPGRVLGRVAHALDPVAHPVRCCALTVAIAGAAAFARDTGEGAHPAQAGVVALVEATAVVVAFAVLGPPLGLRASERPVLS